MMALQPPRLAERLLRWSHRDPDWRDAVCGDLAEEFVTVARRRTVASARRWYWRQSLALVLRFTSGRVVPAGMPRGRFQPAELADASSLGSGWLREWRHAWRTVRRRPVLAAVIVVTLATALAANATIFNLADALYLRPFRFPAVDRLVMISAAPPSDTPFFDRESVAPADFRDWSTYVTTLTDLAAAQWWDPSLSPRNAEEIPEPLAGFRVSSGFFRTLGVGALLRRRFSPEDDVKGAQRVVQL